MCGCRVATCGDRSGGVVIFCATIEYTFFRQRSSQVTTVHGGGKDCTAFVVSLCTFVVVFVYYREQLRNGRMSKNVEWEVLGEGVAKSYKYISAGVKSTILSLLKFLFEAPPNLLSITKLRTSSRLLHGVNHIAALRAFLPLRGLFQWFCNTLHRGPKDGVNVGVCDKDNGTMEVVRGQ